MPDESEEVRDLELIPSTARAKSEAMKLRENPEGEKKGFLDNFKSVCDSVVKVAGLATTVSPIIIGIANLIGIPIPALPI